MKLVIPKIDSPRFLLWIGFVLSILIETLISMEILQDNEFIKIIQYVVILIPVIINFLILFHQRPQTLFNNELESCIIMVFFWLLLSLGVSLHAGKFTFETILQLIQIVLPCAFAYLMINLFNFDEINEFMIFTLILTWIGYLFSIGIEPFLNISNFLSISFIKSYSVFENSTYAELASGLAAYFIYYRKKTPFFTAMVLLLNFLIFKRVFVLMAVILFMISLMKRENDVVKQSTIRWAMVIWCIIIFFVYYIYQPTTVMWISDNFGIDLVAFTMSRIYRLWYMIEENFRSYGLGSTTVFIESLNIIYLGHEFEMDFIRIMFEIGPLAIISFVYTYLKIVRQNKYCFFLICLCFLNLLMANGLVRYWGWTMRILTIAMISNSGDNVNRVSQIPCFRLFGKRIKMRVR